MAGRLRERYDPSMTKITDVLLTLALFTAAVLSSNCSLLGFGRGGGRG